MAAPYSYPNAGKCLQQLIASRRFPRGRIQQISKFTSTKAHPSNLSQQGIHKEATLGTSAGTVVKCEVFPLAPNSPEDFMPRSLRNDIRAHTLSVHRNVAVDASAPIGR